MASLYEMANEWSIRDLKKEYSRLRDQWEKQRKRLQAKKPKEKRLKAFEKGGYKYQRKIEEIENLFGRKNWSEKAIKEDWAKRVAYLQSLRNAKSLSLSGRREIRKSIIATLQNEGYTSINDDTFDDFYKFMNYAKKLNLFDIWGSEYVRDEFVEWMDGGKVDEAELLKYIEKWSKGDEDDEDLFEL